MARKNRTVAGPPEVFATGRTGGELYASRSADNVRRWMEAREFHVAQSVDIVEHRFSNSRGSISVPTATNLITPFMTLRSVQACVTSNLVDYFANATRGRHYAISPCLQHAVNETEKKIRSQQKGRVPVFLVIEEHNAVDSQSR